MLFNSSYLSPMLCVQVEEIDDIDGTSSDPFVADAIANERDLSLTEEQKRNFKKVDWSKAEYSRLVFPFH